MFNDTAISRKVVAKNVHATIPKGNMGYDQYTVPDTVAVESTFVASLSGLSRALFPTTFLEIAVYRTTKDTLRLLLISYYILTY